MDKPWFTFTTGLTHDHAVPYALWSWWSWDRTIRRQRRKYRARTGQRGLLARLVWQE